MKKLFLELSIFLILVFNGCQNEKKSTIGNNNLILTVEFQPSLFRTGRCIIQKHGQDETISLDFIYGNKYRTPPDSIHLKIIDPKNFVTNLPIVVYGDTLFIDSVETVKLKKGQILQFLKDVPIDISTQKSMDLSIPTIDGFQIFFNYKTDTINHNFSFKSFGSDYSNERQLTEAIITLMDQNFKNELTKKYIYSWKLSLGIEEYPHDYGKYLEPLFPYNRVK